MCTCRLLLRSLSVRPTTPSCARVCDGDRLRAARGRGTVAAVFLEPVPGANGVLVPPAGFLPACARACDRDGALLVRRRGAHRLRPHRARRSVSSTRASSPTSSPWPRGSRPATRRSARSWCTSGSRATSTTTCSWAGLTYYAHPLGCAAGVETLAHLRRRSAVRATPRALEPALLEPAGCAWPIAAAGALVRLARAAACSPPSTSRRGGAVERLGGRARATASSRCTSSRGAAPRSSRRRCASARPSWPPACAAFADAASPPSARVSA